MSLLRRSLIVTTAAALLLTNGVYAASTTVAPAFVRLSVSAQQPQDIASIAITNNGDNEVMYALSITDVDVSTGTLLPKETTSELTKQFLQLKDQTVVAQPKKSAAAVVTAKNIEQLPPGGHYAALKITPIINNEKAKKSNIQQAFSVPIFVTKQDGAIKTLQAIVSTGGALHIGSLPNVKVTIKNTGNVDGVVRGFVSYIRGNNTYGKQTFNENSVPLFAGQQQQFTVLAPQKTLNFVGRYTAVVSYKLDGQEQPAIYTASGWFIPWWCVWVCILLAIIAYILIHKRFKHAKSVKIADQPPHPATLTTKTATKKSAVKLTVTKPKIKKPMVISEFGSTKNIK